MSIDPQIIDGIISQLKTRKYSDGSPVATFGTEDRDLALQVENYYLGRNYAVERGHEDNEKPFLLIYPKSEKQDMEEKYSDFFKMFDMGHLDQCQKTYQDYIQKHPHQFKKGEYVTVIEGETVPRGYPNYETASQDTNLRAQGRSWFFTIKDREDSPTFTYNMMACIL